MLPCAPTTSNASERNAAKTNTKPAKIDPTGDASMLPRNGRLPLAAKRCTGLVMFLFLAMPPTASAEIKILPGDIVLTGPKASQRLTVVDVGSGQVVADLSDD